MLDWYLVIYVEKWGKTQYLCFSGFGLCIELYIFFSQTLSFDYTMCINASKVGDYNVIGGIWIFGFGDVEIEGGKHGKSRKINSS